MQTPSNKSQPKLDQRVNGVEDPKMTIEYLRVRLLSERTISKATKERADELAKRVKELEEKLKVVTHQRKRAEKATLDVLSYVEGLGVSDVSDVYESDSNEDDSQCESNMDDVETSKGDKIFASLEVKNNVEECGSEAESTPSSGRSLSWKGRKDSTRHLEKKCRDSPIETRTSLARVDSSSRHRLGRSCRKIKRRSGFEAARQESDKPEAQDRNALNGLGCLDFRNEKGSEKEDVSYSGQAQGCDASSYTHERQSSGKMDRALKRQAQLIRSYEAQEIAQRDWEEKYGDNNDSCEPGSHSDVTEERDENKATVPDPVEVNPCHNQDQKAGINTNSLYRKQSITQFNSFKLSGDADTECSVKHYVSREMQPPTSAAPDFVFSVAQNNNQSWNHAARHSLKHVSQPHPSQKLDGPRKEPAELGVVLDALHEAKLLIKQQISSLSEASNKDDDQLKLAVGCHGLFRVPTGHVDAATSQMKSLSLDYSPGVSNSLVDGNALAVKDHIYNSSASGDPCSTTEISIGQPKFAFHYDSNISARSNSYLSSYSSYPDYFPGTSSNNTIGRQSLSSEFGITPPGYPSFQNHVRPNLYR